MYVTCRHTDLDVFQPQLPKSVRSNLKDPWKTLWSQFKRLSFRICKYLKFWSLCVAFAFLLLGFWVFGLLVWMTRVNRIWLPQKYYLLQNAEASCCKCFCIVEWICVLSTLTPFCLQTLPFLFSSLKSLSP